MTGKHLVINIICDVIILYTITRPFCKYNHLHNIILKRIINKKYNYNMIYILTEACDGITRSKYDLPFIVIFKSFLWFHIKLN